MQLLDKVYLSPDVQIELLNDTGVSGYCWLISGHKTFDVISCDPEYKVKNRWPNPRSTILINMAGHEKWAWFLKIIKVWTWYDNNTALANYIQVLHFVTKYFERCRLQSFVPSNIQIRLKFVPVFMALYKL